MLKYGLDGLSAGLSFSAPAVSIEFPLIRKSCKTKIVEVRKKGTRIECDNSRGFCMLSAIGNITRLEARRTFHR